MTNKLKAKTQHTPTPWAICQSAPSLIRVDDFILAQTFGRHSSSEVDEMWANAEFIVRAVNSHEHLLNACKIALPELELDARHGEQDAVKAVKVLKAAIAKAEAR